MGSRLPSAGEVLIIRPAGKKGQRLIVPARLTPLLPGAACQEAPAFQSRIRSTVVQTECSPSLKQQDSQNSHFPMV